MINSVLTLDAASLMAEARDITSISIVDHDIVEPLTVLCKSLNEESQLHEEGAREQHRKLLRILCNRLRMQRDIQAHPSILEQEIKAPIIVCGMGRTGSTKTHKLLAATGDFNWLPFWQSFNPASITGKPGESTDVRIRLSDEYNHWFDQVSPEAKYGHEFDTHEPNEESWILEHSLTTPIFQGWCSIPSYLKWVLDSGQFARQFVFLRDCLKYLQWQGLHDPNRRWVLKSPLYFGLEPALREVFPDAYLVMTHRDPAQVAPSTIKLVHAYFKPHTNVMVEPEVMLRGFARQMEAHLSYRKQNPDARFLDVYYRELIEDDIKVLEKIYAFCGLPLHNSVRQRVRDWSTQNPKNKKGGFTYSLEEFGLTEEGINALFHEYKAFLLERFGV